MRDSLREAEDAIEEKSSVNDPITRYPTLDNSIEEKGCTAR